MIFLYIGSLLTIAFLVWNGRQRFKETTKEKEFMIIKTRYVLGSDEEAIMNGINDHRVDHYKRPLIADLKVTILSKQRNQEMIESGELSHESSHDEFNELILHGADQVGENIAFGHSTPEAVVNAWIKSEGHNRTMLNENFDMIGVNVLKDQAGRNYFTTMFVGDNQIKN